MKSIHSEIQQIEAYTKEDLFIYFAEISKKKFGPGHEQRLDKSDTQFARELLEHRGEKKENLYLMIQSPGGHIAESMNIIEAMRGHYSQIHLVVTTYAGSAAAYLCLCGDTLYMRSNAFLSDFGPQNWKDETISTAEELRAQGERLVILYQTMIMQLGQGTMRGHFSNIPSVLTKLGGPCVSGESPDGRIHGTPLAIDNLKSLIPNIKPISDIPAPGNATQYVADNFTKLSNLVVKKMRSKDLAKILIYGGNEVSTTFTRT